MKRVIEHQKKGENVFIYAYLAGHGVADNRQYFLTNSDDPQKALFPIEEKLRNISSAGKGKCFVFAVYDICRVSNAALKRKADDQAEQKRLQKQLDRERKRIEQM